jgi:hypothetical protein
MSKFTPWTANRFYTVAGSTLLVAAIIGGVAWIPLRSYALKRAADHAAIAAREPEAWKAIGEYELAHVLDPGNPAYRLPLANLYVTQGQPQKAIAALGGSESERMRKAALLMQQTRYNEALAVLEPLTTSAAAIVRSQIYLEEGSGGAAIAAVAHPSTGDERVQLGLADMVGGNTQATAALAGDSDTATQAALLHLQTGGLTLAQEVYSRQLYRSTQRVLTPLSDSPAKYLLLANTLLAEQPTDRNQTLAAQAASQQGIKLDPASLPLHELLESIDSQLGDHAGGAHEQQLIDQLRNGTI